MPAGIQRVPAGQKHHKTTKPQLSSFCSPKMLSTSAPLSPHPLSPTRKRVLSPALEHVPKRHKLSVGDKELSSAPAPEQVPELQLFAYLFAVWPQEHGLWANR
jgi:hypothetical protein